MLLTHFRIMLVTEQARYVSAGHPMAESSQVDSIQVKNGRSRPWSHRYSRQASELAGEKWEMLAVQDTKCTETTLVPMQR